MQNFVVLWGAHMVSWICLVSHSHSFQAAVSVVTMMALLMSSLLQRGFGSISTIIGIYRNLLLLFYYRNLFCRGNQWWIWPYCPTGFRDSTFKWLIKCNYRNQLKMFYISPSLMGSPPLPNSSVISGSHSSHKEVMFSSFSSVLSREHLSPCSILKILWRTFLLP